MTNETFLKVNKSLFGSGLKPIELLIVSQVLEYQTKKLDCFISDEALASNFGVSNSTISRAIRELEGKGILSKKTTNTQKGKLRYLFIDEAKLNAFPNSQNDSCGIVNLTISNKQNDSIKDNIKDKTIKDNLTEKPTRVEVVNEVVKQSSSSNGSFNF